MNKRTQSTAGLALAIGLLAACGGSADPVATDATDPDDVVETTPTDTTPPTEPPVTEPAVTEPPPTEPPVTEPPATDPPQPDLPEWASGAMVTVQTDTGPLEMPVELAPFCESSRSFYVAAKGLDFVTDEQVGTAQQLFAALAVLAPLAIDTSPSEEFAIQPTAARDDLAVLIPAFEEIEYDGSRIGELSDPESVIASVQGFTETRNSLQAFLIQACGADGETLDEQSRNAVAVAAEAIGETIEPDEPVEAVAGSPVTNEDVTIGLSVPAGWTETDEPVRSGRSQFVVSPDIAAFSELVAPGVLVLRGEGGFRDGGFVGRVLEFESDLLEVGCVAVDKDDYDDGIYNGQERTFECGTDGLDVRLFGGTTADESLYAMVLLVHPSDEPGIRQLIVDTFQVS